MSTGLVLLVILGLYFLPTIVAGRHPNSSAIFVLNLLLGWTFVGWVIALVWACTKPNSLSDSQLRERDSTIVDDEVLRQNINRAQGVGPQQRISWFRWGIVAAVVGAVGIGAWFRDTGVPSTVATSTTAPTPLPATTKPASPAASSSDQTKQSDAPADANKAALVKAMNDAVAARHGGVLPKTMSESDMNVALQAAAKVKAKQTAEQTKHTLDAMKAKPAPSSGYAEIAFAKEALTKMLRDPDSAVFGDVFFVNDRKSETGYYVPVVCGTVNAKNGFGGMTGQKHFVAVTSDAVQGLWLEGTTPQSTFAPEWNRFCAGRHDQ